MFAVTCMIASTHSSTTPESTSVRHATTREPPVQSTESSFTTHLLTTVRSDGPSTQSEITDGGPLTASQIAAVVVGIVAGIAAAAVLLAVLLHRTQSKFLLFTWTAELCLVQHSCRLYISPFGTRWYYVELAELIVKQSVMDGSLGL